MDEVKLLPCLDCGGEARREAFGHDTVGPLFICSNNLMFGGECSEDYAYLSEEAWNEANTRPTIVTDEVVERAWREGFQSARECLSDDEAFTLTVDVEEDCWRDSKARAIAAMPTIDQDGGWQPIESAPRDGTAFDAWAVWLDTGEGERVPNVEWGRGYIAFESKRGEIEGWVAERWGIDGSMGAMDAEDQTLTHWRLPPEPPAQPEDLSAVFWT